MSQYEFKMESVEILRGTVEADSLEEAKEKAKNGEIVGDYRVVDSINSRIYDFEEV
jgi:hypothetical protein